MSRIPVGATIAHAYRFAFGGFVDLVRVSWLPLTGIVALMFLVVLPALSDIMSALSAQAIGTVGADFLRIVPAYLAVMLLFLVLITAMTQSALGLPQSGGWLVFPFDRPLWRLAGAFLLLMLIMIGTLVVLGLLAVITSVTVGTGGTPWVSLVIRLSVNVLILVLPFIILELVALFWLMPHMPTPAPGIDPNQYRMAVMDWEAGTFAGLRSHWLVALPLWALFTILIYGLLVGAQCFAYRAVTEGAETS